MLMLILIVLLLGGAESLVLDDTFRVINDTSLWDVNLMKQVTFNATWNDGGPRGANPYAHEPFSEKSLCGYHVKRDLYLNDNGAIVPVPQKHRAKILQIVEAAKTEDDMFLITNEDYYLILREAAEVPSIDVGTLNTVRVFDVRPGIAKTDIRPDDCDCVYDFDKGYFTTGLDHEVNLYRNTRTETCPGDRVCVMTRQATRSPFMAKDAIEDLRKIFDTIIFFENEALTKRCKPPLKLDVLRGMLDYLLEEKPNNLRFHWMLKGKSFLDC